MAKKEMQWGGADGRKLRNRAFTVQIIRYKSEDGKQKILLTSAKTGDVLFAIRADQDNVKCATTLPDFMVEQAGTTKQMEVVDA